MITIEPHEEGFLVKWDPAEQNAAVSLGDELFFCGLRRTRDTPSSFVVPRYRNDLETLGVLLKLCEAQGFTPALDNALSQRQISGEAELNLLNTIRKSATVTKRIPAQVPEFGTNRKLLYYQRLAVAKHLQVIHSADFSVPGSGKTTVALATWAYATRDTPELGLWVIGPLSCFQPWEEEFLACFGRDAEAMRLQGNSNQRLSLLRSVANYELVLTSYHTAWREVDGIESALAKRPWMMVIDEAHYVKSMSGVLAATVRRLSPRAARRLALTGTPMPRAPEDLWSIFTFLWPSEALLGNAAQYSQRCKQPVRKVCEELREELAPFFHRTTKDALGMPAVRQSYPVVAADSLPKTQRLMIRLIERRTLEEDSLLRARDQAHVRRWRRARLIRLMQAVGNPLLLADALSQVDIAVNVDNEGADATDDVTIPLVNLDSDLARALVRYRDTREVSGKIRFVADRCRELVAGGNKVVLWTVFLGNVSLLEQLLADLRPLVITGSVPTEESVEDESEERTREQRITLFKTDESRRVLIANAAACAESVSLHKVCQHALYLERSFNAAHFIQSMDRIHRQGMPKGTTAHIEIPSIPCAIERVINRRLAARQEVLYQLLNDPMPIVGFDDEAHQGYFDVEDLEGIDKLFSEVLAEIRADSGDSTA